MVIQFRGLIQWKAQNLFSLYICTAYQEELAVFNHMRKNIIRSTAPVTQINDRSICPGPVSHLAEGAVLTAFPGRLD